MAEITSGSGHTSVEVQANLNTAEDHMALQIGRVLKQQQSTADKAGRAHDEAMRMQALAIGARIVCADPGPEPWRDMLEHARWTYREATGREW